MTALIVLLVWFVFALLLEGVVNAQPGSFANKAKQVLFYVLTAPSAVTAKLRDFVTRKVEFTKFHAVAFWFKN